MSGPVTGLIPWCPALGKPLGQVQLQSPCEQDCPMLARKFPSDLLKVIYSLAGSGILETCRAAYQVFSPFAKWVDVFDLNAKAIGFFILEEMFLEEVLGVSIRANQTYKARYRSNGGILDQTWEGTWDLIRESGLPRELSPMSSSFSMHHPIHFDLPDQLPGLGNLTLDPPNEDEMTPVSLFSTRIRFTSPMEIPGSFLHYNLVVSNRHLEDKRQKTEYDVIDALPAPFNPNYCYMMECGVPHDLQNSEVPCCLDVVKDVVESVWCNPSCQQLGTDVKEAVALKVATACMAPPGMTRNEIRVAIARELADHQQWKSMIQPQIVS